MDPADVVGTAVCILGFVLMASKLWHPRCCQVGLWIMLSGTLILMLHSIAPSRKPLPISRSDAILAS
jgi:hypothetical protein